jgi:hypothetical protein
VAEVDMLAQKWMVNHLSVDKRDGDNLLDVEDSAVVASASFVEYEASLRGCKK